MASFWKLLRVAHIKKFIAEDWGLADGIYIPKEKNSKYLEQFWPISLLNIEGKVFFGVIAKRMMRFVLNNKFNISIQKAGIPGFPGCIERASMLWDRIKVDFFWIPEDLRKLISGYYKCTYMRFSNVKYSTNWQKLNIGIMMGCVKFPLIFVLVMEMLLRSTEDTTSITFHWYIKKWKTRFGIK